LTICVCRFYIKCDSSKKTLQLTLLYGGLSVWLEKKIKAIKKELKGPEVKGINIINIHLLESPQNHQNIGQWVNIINTFEYKLIYDMRLLSNKRPIERVKGLIALASEVLLTAPWPQAHAIGQLLSTPPTDKEMLEIQLCLTEYEKQWQK
jgi:hypothetical protein